MGKFRFFFTKSHYIVILVDKKKDWVKNLLSSLIYWLFDTIGVCYCICKILFHSRAHVTEIVNLWKTLLSQTDLKGNKLKEASQQQQFNRSIEDVEAWLYEIEGQLKSEDYGKVTLFLTSLSYI